MTKPLRELVEELKPRAEVVNSVCPTCSVMVQSCKLSRILTALDKLITAVEGFCSTKINPLIVMCVDEKDWAELAVKIEAAQAVIRGEVEVDE